MGVRGNERLSETAMEQESESERETETERRVRVRERLRVRGNESESLNSVYKPRNRVQKTWFHLSPPVTHQPTQKIS